MKIANPIKNEILSSTAKTFKPSNDRISHIINRATTVIPQKNLSV